MMNLFRAAFVIGRRDFTATVYSRTFLLFLMGPLFIIGISFLFGAASAKMARQDLKANIAIIASKAEYGERSPPPEPGSIRLSARTSCPSSFMPSPIMSSRRR